MDAKTKTELLKIAMAMRKAKISSAEPQRQTSSQTKDADPANNPA